jgi:histidine ammonia-lyase
MFELNGKNLTVESLVNVARNNTKLKISDDSLSKIKKTREFLNKKVKAKEVIYGVNTGIGEFSEIVLPDDKLKDFQKYLIYNHSAGIGEPAKIEYIRGAMTGRINVHSKGYSAIRPEITLTLVEMLNKGVTPVVAQKGSVGACGDLAPMSQIAQTLMGEGHVFYNGQKYQTKEAFKFANIEIPGLDVRDGLGTINGSNLLTAMSAIHIHDYVNLIKHAEIAAALSLEALMANLKPYSERIHTLRGFEGSVLSAQNIRKMTEGSDLLNGKVKVKVQDAYSMRSTPQVIGATRDALKWAKSQVEIELNGVGDNPIFIEEDNLVLSGANFQGTPVSVPMDMLGATITMMCVISERRLNRLLNPALSSGLPAFLTKNPGFFSGLMLSQYTADSLIVEQKILSSPAFIQSIPAAADQEDFVSMGMNTALKNEQIRDNAYGIIGIELMAAAQAMNFREFKMGSANQIVFDTIRETVDFLDVDRPLHYDHDKMVELVKSNKIIENVENAIGKLS